MRSFADDLAAFARENGMELKRAAGASIVTVHAGSPHVVEVTAPDDVHEWFVVAREAQSGIEIFSDWCEHYGREPEVLHAERLQHITWLVRTVRGANLRVTKGGRWLVVAVLEVEAVSGWIDVWQLELRRSASCGSSPPPRAHVLRAARVAAGSAET